MRSIDLAFWLSLLIAEYISIKWSKEWHPSDPCDKDRVGEAIKQVLLNCHTNKRNAEKKEQLSSSADPPQTEEEP